MQDAVLIINLILIALIELYLIVQNYRFQILNVILFSQKFK